MVLTNESKKIQLPVKKCEILVTINRMDMFDSISKRGMNGKVYLDCLSTE